MVHRPLPPELIARLKKANNRNSVQKNRAKSFKRLFLRLQNIDSRRNRRDVREAKAMIGFTTKNAHEKFDALNDFFGERVRVFNVSRNYPAIEKVVFKRVDGISAKGLITLLGHSVAGANMTAHLKRSSWILKEPFLYPINEQVVAMAVTGFPSIREILGFGLAKQGRTKRGKRFFAKVVKQHSGLTKERFEKLAREVVNASGLRPHNILFLGMKNGKCVFAPLADHEWGGDGY